MDGDVMHLFTVKLPLIHTFCPSSAPTCIFLFFYLLFTRYWLISVLYFVWWFIDYDTPGRGGRRVPLLCGLKLWGYMRDYFPIKVSYSLFDSGCVWPTFQSLCVLYTHITAFKQP